MGLPELTLPVTDPVLIFALAMIIFLLAPLLMERMRVPGIIGIILAGAVLGPNALNILDRSSTMVLLGTVGLLYLMFMAGIELDLHGFRRYRRRSIVFGLISFSVPMALASLLMPMLGFGWAAALLIGSIVGSHTLLAYPIAVRLGLLKNAAVTTVVGGTLVTDSLALGVLAVIAGAISGRAGVGFWLVLAGALSLYVLVVLLGVPRLGRWFFRKTPGGGSAEFIFLMVVLFAASYFADLAGAQPIIGAFLAGLAMNRLVPNDGRLMNRIRFVGNALFIPFFLLSVGMLVDGRVLIGGLGVWVIAGVLIGVVVVGKLAGALVTMKVFGHTKEEGLTMFGLSSPQAAATLAVTFVGLEMGLFGEPVVNAVIVMILVTVLIGPSVVEKYGRTVALQEEQRPMDPTEAPQRILVPMARPATASDLMDLALSIREPDSTEPIYPMTVFPADEERSSELVTEAENMLSHAVGHAAAADVPAIPITRMDHNFANGMVRGIAETRTTTVIIGWDGRRSRLRGVFGSVLDQLLDQTKQQILVARMGHPLNTTERIVALVPQGTDHLPGYLDAVRSLKLMASRLGAGIEGITVGAPAELYHEQFDTVKPDAETTFEQVETWPAVISKLRSELGENDLVVVFGARPRAVSWTPALDRLPGMLVRLVPESFLMLYPSEQARRARHPRRGGAALPESLTVERILLDLASGSYRDVLRTILETEFGDDTARLVRIENTLARSAEAFAAEVRPGVVVPHTTVADLRRPLAFLGISPEGVLFPHADEPAHLIFILLTPDGKPGEHLNRLAEIVTLVSNQDRVDAMLAAASVEELIEAAPTEDAG